MGNATNHPSAGVKCRQIGESDFNEVAALLGKGLGYSFEHYSNMFQALRRRKMPAGYPKFGLLLEANGKIVGAIGLIYANLKSSGNTLTRCHVTSWYVEPEFKIYAALLASKAINRKDVTYVNLSARPQTRPNIQAQGFIEYSHGQFVSFLFLNIFKKKSDTKLTPFGQNPPGEFTQDHFEMMSAHHEFGCICVWVTSAGRSLPFIFRSKSFKGWVRGVQLIYCEDTEALHLFIRPISEYLMKLNQRLLSIDANDRMPGLAGMYFDGVSPRFCKGVKPALGDLAFTLNAIVPFTRREM